MAVVLPVIHAISTVAAAGSVAAAVSTIGGFLSVAGGVLTGIGALTGKKDLLKLGGVMSLASSLGNLAGGAAEGASAEASSAWDAADSAAGSDAAQFGKYAAPGGASLTAPAEGAQIGTIGTPTMPNLRADPLGSMQPSIMERAGAAPAIETAPIAARPDAVMQAGQSMDAPTMQSILDSAWQKTKALGSGVGQFVRDNKELVQIGGSMLNSMYGSDAEAIDMQKSILARRLRNLNSPVRLGRVSTIPEPSPIGG